MSPEIQDCKKYTYSTDVWSTGCVIFELITLEKYFDYLKKLTCDQKFNDTNLNYLYKNLLIQYT
jgi:serine/threonine protein kinase